MNFSHRLGTLSLLTLFACTAAQAANNVFDIPSQPLSEALVQLAQQSNILIMAPQKLVDGKRAPQVHGAMSVEEALTKLLAGSGLKASAAKDGSITVHEVGAREGSAGELLSESMRVAQSKDPDSPDNANAAGSAEQTSGAPEDKSAKIDEVVVTAQSRLGRPDVPTPLLSVSVDVLREVPRTNIIAALNDLPQFRATITSQTTGGGFSPGAYAIDLRGLGISRTLSLLDGRRLVSSPATPDRSVIPTPLISRVDIVTGGASAAWGSDAVAGVVNFVIDSELEGIRLGVRGGVSSRDDIREKAFEGAFGTGFADGRGHFIVGGEYVDNQGGGPRTDREMIGRWAAVPLPSGLTITPDVGTATFGSGGLILSGVNIGKAFNPSGTLRTYDFGTRIGATTTVGGENLSSTDDIISFYAPSKRYNLMARVTYDLSDTLKLTADVLHARTGANFPFFSNQNAGDITITLDNAFLPAAIRNQMIAAGQTSFTMGRFNEDYAVMYQDYSRTTSQASLQLDGKIGAFAWQAYYTQGKFREDIDVSNERVRTPFALAVDAVINPATGLPVCRASLTNAVLAGAGGCVPINLFGNGNVSPQAAAYVTGTSMARNTDTLDTGGISLRGEPLDLWAGPLSVALGAEARRESLDNHAGPIDRAGGFTVLNFSEYNGSNTTKEVFSEMQLPVLRDVPLLKLLQVNAAGRRIKDGTGYISAWKLGLIDEVVSGVQVRLTRSRDVRAPNNFERFNPRLGPGVPRVNDPFNNNASVQIQSFTGGNLNLKPEQALTTTAGITLAPVWIPRLNFSVDYFDINVTDAIETLAPQDVVNGCFLGNPGLCSAIARNGAGTILIVEATAQNFQSFKTSGFDFALGYTLPIGAASNLGLRSNWTWLRKYEQDAGVLQANGTTTIDYVGTQGFASTRGGPRVRGSTTLYGQIGNFEANIRGRYVSSGKHNNIVNYTNNDIPAFVYVDLGFQYTLPDVAGSDMEFFGNVANALDKDQPPGGRNDGIYDAIGRYYTAGVKVRF